LRNFGARMDCENLGQEWSAQIWGKNRASSYGARMKCANMVARMERANMGHEWSVQIWWQEWSAQIWGENGARKYGARMERENVEQEWSAQKWGKNGARRYGARMERENVGQEWSAQGMREGRWLGYRKGQGKGRAAGGQAEYKRQDTRAGQPALRPTRCTVAPLALGGQQAPSD
jgi:hypothetical protein